MKKSILNLGNVLSKKEQKQVSGGANLTKLDPNCERVVNEGICWGYSMEAQYDYGSEYEYGFDVYQVGGGVQGSGYYEYPCAC